MALIENKIVIVAERIISEFFDVKSYYCWSAEIARRSGHLLHFASGDEVLIDRGERVGVNGEHFIENRAAARASEIKIRVIGEIDYGRLIGGRVIGNPHLVVFRQRVSDADP